MDELSQRLLGTIEANRERIVQFLVDMVAFPSINPCPPDIGQELALQEWLRERLGEMGFDEVDSWAADPEGKRPNVVAVLRGTGNEEERRSRSLIFNGHCDVVPVQEEERPRWTVDPWKSVIRDGEVYGRGTTDMKGGLAAIIWAARTLIECGVKLRGDLFVESTVGEESGEGATIGAMSAIERGYRAPFAVVAEPTEEDIRISSPGIFFFELVIPGKECHIADRNRVIYPQKHGVHSGAEVGVDAITKAVPFIQMFERIEQQLNHRWKERLLPEEAGIATFTINPTFIQGGNYGASVVPGSCRLVYNVRYPNWVNDEEVWAELKRHVEALASTDDWLREHPPEFKVPVIRRWKPMIETPPDSPSVQLLASTVEEVGGQRPDLTSFKGMGDTSFLTQSGIPAVLYGPGGHDCGLHGPDEHVRIDDVIQVTKVLTLFARRWCGG